MKGANALAAETRRRDAEDRAARLAAAEAAKVPSPAEAQAEKDRAAFFSWRDSGDYRKPPPSMIGLNYGPEAARRRETEQTAVPAGLLGMGASYADPTALALSRQNMADTNAESDANAYQGAITAEDTYQRTGNSMSLMAQDYARKMGLLNDASSASQFSTNARIQTQPQSILPMLFSGLISGASAFATGGLSSIMTPHPAPAPSDSRLKENIRRLDGVHAVAFEWNEGAAAFGLDPGTKSVGLLADEIEKVFPEFVSPLGDTELKGIDYQGLSAYLIELVKEMNRETVTA